MNKTPQYVKILVYFYQDLLLVMKNLYHFIYGTFCVIVVISNIISAKLFTVPFFNLDIPAGLITYPLTFLLSDLVTEIYGSAKARLMVYAALGTSILSSLVIQLALKLPTENPEKQEAFNSILGVNGWIVFASLTAYTVGQLLDIQIYALIKTWTGERFLWLRNNGSTIIAQIFDTLIVNIIHLYWGLGMEFGLVAAIMVFSYLYKVFFSIMNVPLFYALVYFFKTKKNNQQIILIKKMRSALKRFALMNN